MKKALLVSALLFVASPASAQEVWTSYWNGEDLVIQTFDPFLFDLHGELALMSLMAVCTDGVMEMIAFPLGASAGEFYGNTVQLFYPISIDGSPLDGSLRIAESDFPALDNREIATAEAMRVVILAPKDGGPMLDGVELETASRFVADTSQIAEEAFQYREVCGL